MSTTLRPKDEINFEELFDGRLERFGIQEAIIEGSTSANNRCLTDGNNSLWIYGDEVVEGLIRYASNRNPEKILVAIEEAFDTDIFSEHQPQYWGFETEEEWYGAWDKMHEEHEAKFYKESNRKSM